MDLGLDHVAFERDGYTVVRRAVGAATVAAALAHLDAVRGRLGLPADAPIVAPPPGDPAAERLAGDAGLTTAAAAVLGTPVTCFGLTYLTKAANGGLAARWHQDAGPWAQRLGGAAAATVWLALTGADEASGCLRVVPGSHRLAAQPLRPDWDGPSLFGVGMDPDLVEASRARPVAVGAGDVVVHHPNLVHASGTNGSPLPRIALAVRYRAGP